MSLDREIYNAANVADFFIKKCKGITNLKLQQLVDMYGDSKPRQLVAITHREGSPWDQSYTGEWAATLDKSIIRNHYRALL